MTTSYLVRNPIELSSLGFGCAPVMGRVDKSQALRAMAEAFDLGVTHFDVARSYGFGQAEQVVGAFIKGRRAEVTITSKFGVVPPHLSSRTKALIPVARMMASWAPQLKAKIKKKSGQLLVARNFDVSYARKCLDQSLAAMATDYIDIYLVHEPDATLLKNPEEIRSLLEDCVRAGKIRRWGFAYQAVQDYEWACDLGGDVLQFEGNVETLPRCGAIFGDVRQKIVTRPFRGGFTEKPARNATLEEMGLTQTLEDMGASVADVFLCLANQMAGQSGSVLCSMFSSAHIKKNVQSIAQFSKDPRMHEVLEKLRYRIQHMPKRLA